MFYYKKVLQACKKQNTSTKGQQKATTSLRGQEKNLIYSKILIK